MYVLLRQNNDENKMLKLIQLHFKYNFELFADKASVDC